MKPEVDLVLQGYAGTLLMDVAPHLGAEYSIGNVSVMALSLFMASEEYDRAADIRVRENAGMRALFAEAAGLVEDAGLAGRLREAAATSDTSLRIGALNASNDALKTLLIELQSAVEASKAAWAAAFEKRIWQFLIESAEERKVSIPALG